MDIQELLAGNRRFASGIDKRVLQKLAEQGQHPSAAIVSCSDSRVPVEVIFNRLEPGTLFIIRIAGNVVSDTSVKGSIEYAVTYLKVPYLIVLGHTGCGAVEARLAGTAAGELGKLVNNIQLKSRDLAEAIVENLALQVKRALEMDCVKEAVDKGVLKVYGMLYDLNSGEVKYLGENGLLYEGATSPKERGRFSFPAKGRGHSSFPTK
jgi:carbonic anhydrase